MDWRLAKKGEYTDSEWVQVANRYDCAIPLYCEKSTGLASLVDIKRSWRSSFLESAQADVIKVVEGYFIVNPDGRYNRPPIFEELPEPRPHCLLRRVS